MLPTKFVKSRLQSYHHRGQSIDVIEYTLKRLSQVNFAMLTERPIDRLETIYHGAIDFEATRDGIAFCLPLDCTDYVKIYYRKPH